MNQDRGKPAGPVHRPPSHDYEKLSVPELLALCSQRSVLITPEKMTKENIWEALRRDDEERGPSERGPSLIKEEVEAVTLGAVKTAASAPAGRKANHRDAESPGSKRARLSYTKEDEFGNEIRVSGSEDAGAGENGDDGFGDGVAAATDGSAGGGAAASALQGAAFPTDPVARACWLRSTVPSSRFPDESRLFEFVWVMTVKARHESRMSLTGGEADYAVDFMARESLLKARIIAVRRFTVLSSIHQVRLRPPSSPPLQLLSLLANTPDDLVREILEFMGEGFGRVGFDEIWNEDEDEDEEWTEEEEEEVEEEEESDDEGEGVLVTQEEENEERMAEEEECEAMEFSDLTRDNTNDKDEDGEWYSDAKEQYELLPDDLKKGVLEVINKTRSGGKVLSSAWTVLDDLWCGGVKDSEDDSGEDESEDGEL